MKTPLLFGILLLLLGAFIAGCKKQDSTPPTALEAAVGRHEGGHCHHRSLSGPQYTTVEDTTFDDGIVTITRVNDQEVSADGYGLSYPIYFPMPVESPDTVFHAETYSNSRAFGITINTSSRTILTGEHRYSYELHFDVYESGLWKF